MTKIKIFKKVDRFTGFEISGHTGFDEYGKDVLCSAISTLVQSVALGITRVVGIKAKIKKDEDSGYLKVELPNNISDKMYNEVRVLFETMIISIEDLLKGYSKYISMEVIGNVY